MDSKFKYQRSFFIFDEEDGGFGTDQKPSGHVKVEIKEGKGKLYCQVNNLSEDNGKIQYQLFLIKSDGYKVVPVRVGNIELKRNRGDLVWDFDPYNIGKTNLSFDKFNVIAVLANYADKENDYIICPLSAYKNGKVEWRQQLNEVLQQEKFSMKLLNKNQGNDDIPNKISNESFEAINKKQEVVENKQIKVDSKETASGEKEPNYGQKPDDLLKIETDNEHKLDIEDYIEPLEKDKINKESKPEENQAEKESVNKEAVEEKNAEEKTSQENSLEENITEENIIEENVTQEKKIKEKKNQPPGKSYSSYNGSKLFDIYTDEISNDVNDNTKLNTSCMNCIFLNNKKEDKPQIKEFSSEELHRQFDSIFERYSPFLAKRTDYIWWKVASPVHLNNILYNFGIQIPFLFNPLVLMAHNKYNHLIVGIYRDDIHQRDYIVCGVPGIYWVDEKPFGNACRWAQVEGNTPTYGAFGYWIVYINPKTGKVLAIDE
ncbi:hypothetical protein [Acetivibrio clariflavus]|uniref:Uncharacterized protein n=1 Tax=Acetivibrio clariflavus (strain DSM 19732 / NBRC 101661 / EBR45) TaxID=720554 RepID=G8LST8_ACECE|nr:hypothetical protein [Acetivibrio clariflavus]AEV70451.1 hypothetical protein Clocl_4015 [Acetivibrio clariflavus DSM 19732]